jgi:hypothetical protein
VTPAEWQDILELIRLLWPSAKSWPPKAEDRCYRQLRNFKAGTVRAAVEALKGPHPVSPAVLEAKVAELAAAEARYMDRAALPDGVYEAEKTQAHAESIRGEYSWADWLEERRGTVDVELPQ